MGAFATMAAADARAVAKVADGTWTNAHSCRQVDGTIAVRVQRNRRRVARGQDVDSVAGHRGRRMRRRQASTFQEAKDRAAAFAGEDKPALKNQATGMEAKVSRSNVAKMLSGKAVGKSVSPAVQALAVANVDKLFEMARLGEKLGGKLRGLMAKHPSIGDVRGKGLLAGTDQRTFAALLIRVALRGGKFFLALLFKLQRLRLSCIVRGHATENSANAGDRSADQWECGHKSRLQISMPFSSAKNSNPSSFNSRSDVSNCASRGV